MQSPTRDSQNPTHSHLSGRSSGKFNSKPFPTKTNQRSNKRGRRTREKKKRPFLIGQELRRPPLPHCRQSGSSRGKKPCKKHLILVPSCSICQISYVRKQKETRVLQQQQQQGKKAPGHLQCWGPAMPGPPPLLQWRLETGLLFVLFSPILDD